MIAGLKPYPAMKDSGVEWLGEVPSHWDVRRNGRLFAQRNETGFAELPVLEVSLRTGVRIRNFGNSDRKQMMSERDKYKRALAGDIAYNMMRMWQGAVGVAPVDGLVSPAYVVARPLPGTEARYFEKLFRTPNYMQEVDNCSRGIVKDRNRLYWEYFKAMPTCYPPVEEQDAIVRYLDYVERRVRRLVRAKRKLIALLTEKKQAIIHHAVTRGVDPNVPLKGSGVEWLGKVPEHWEVGPLKRFVARRPGAIKAGPFGSQLTAAEMLGSAAKVYTQRNVIDRNLEAGNNYVNEAKFEALRAFEVFPGDVLVTSRGTIGRTALVTECCHRGILHPCLLRIQPNVARIVPEFVMALIQDSQLLPLQLKFLSNATTIDVIYSGTLANVVIPVPPLPEQHAILSDVRVRTTEIDIAITRCNREIEFLNEYRTRLIADVVTGKLDVREVAAALPEVDPLVANAEPDDTLDNDAETELDEPDATLEEDKA